LSDQRLHLVLDGNVGPAKDAVRAEFGGERLAFRHAAPGDDDFRALNNEDLGGAQPDAAGCAGNDRYLAVQPSHVVLRFGLSETISNADAALCKPQSDDRAGNAAAR
jgi:hypothetical protein